MTLHLRRTPYQRINLIRQAQARAKRQSDEGSRRRSSTADEDDGEGDEGGEELDAEEKPELSGAGDVEWAVGEIEEGENGLFGVRNAGEGFQDDEAFKGFGDVGVERRAVL